MEILRRKLIYKLFIEQFIDMTKVSLTKYHAFDQAIILLKQADRLCYLLADDKFYQDAQTFIQIIEQLRENTLRMKREILNGPELPRRLSLADDKKFSQRMNYQVQSIADNNEGLPSDDDNDEIYSYHKSVVAQIHATNSENLARFQHADENDDEIENTVYSFRKVNLNDKGSENNVDTTSL